jgi:phage tail P2-like protein
MSDLLPSNATNSERALSLSVARLGDVPVAIGSVWSPDTCPDEMLPWLAWAMSVDDWDSGWSVETKRSVIRESIAVHRRKGTRASIQLALHSAGYGDSRVEERFGWDHYDGEFDHSGVLSYAPPDHWAEYRVYLTRPISKSQADKVREILVSVAPARSHLKGLFFTEAPNLYNQRIVHDGAFSYGVA